MTNKTAPAQPTMGLRIRKTDHETGSEDAESERWRVLTRY